MNLFNIQLCRGETGWSQFTQQKQMHKNYNKNRNVNNTIILECVLGGLSHVLQEFSPLTLRWVPQNTFVLGLHLTQCT